MRLRHLVDQLSAGIPALTSGKNRIINNINPLLQAYTGDELLNRVMDSLLKYAALQSGSRHIRIAAKKHTSLTIVQIKYSDNAGHEIENDLNELKMLARQIGGCLYISKNFLGTTISFTFLNFQLPLAA